MCAPHTMTSMVFVSVSAIGSAAGSGRFVAPIVVTPARCTRAPSASSSTSFQAGAISETPNGSPADVKPAGTATAVRSMRFTKFV